MEWPLRSLRSIFHFGVPGEADVGLVRYNALCSSSMDDGVSGEGSGALIEETKNGLIRVSTERDGEAGGE